MMLIAVGGWWGGKRVCEREREREREGVKKKGV